METTTLGKTGLQISRLGAGLAEIGRLEDEARAAQVLHAALDGGITFFDTAACYGRSEEYVGRALGNRRGEFVLATKAGHVVGDYQGQEWTRQTILDSIDRSLQRMQVDYVDLVQLHSCGVEILQRGEAIDALREARAAGKTRFIGYSGDGDAAMWAVESGAFDTLQTTFNLLDQDACRTLFGKARERGMGIIIKRPIANAAWTGHARSDRYRDLAERMRAMGPIPAAPEDPITLSLGFTLAHNEVDTAIVGTADPEHMRANIARAEREMPVSTGVVEELHFRFDRLTGRSQPRGAG